MSSYTSGRSVLVCIGINIALVVLLALLLAWWVCDCLRPCPVKLSYTSGRSVLVCIGTNIALVVLLALLLAWWVCDCLRPPCPVKLSSYTSGVRVVLVACIVKFIWLQEPWPQVGVLVIPSSSLSS